MNTREHGPCPSLSPSPVGHTGCWGQDKAPQIWDRAREIEPTISKEFFLVGSNVDKTFRGNIGGNTMSERVDAQVVKSWLERLRTGDETERAQAASELSRLHVRVRGSVRTRGGLHQSARSEFPSELSHDAMRTALAALQDDSPAVRREVAFALGEWGDENAATILHAIVLGKRQDPEEEVRRAGIAALGTIGGPTAVQTLCQVAEDDPAEAVRYDAVAALTELGLQEQPGAPVRTTGAVRTRGVPVRARASLGREAQQVVATLQRIRDKESEKEHIRRMAEAALAPLAE